MIIVNAVGNTYDNKEDLRENGFTWDKVSKSWGRKFETQEEYDRFIEHFNNVTYYGRHIVNKLHSQVKFETITTN